MLLNSRWLLFFTGTVFVGFIGCNTNDLENTAIPVPSANDIDVDEITSTLPVKNAADVSPASPKLQLPQSEAAPVDVAKKFISFLNNEDRDSFELLLTPVALNAVSRMQFQLPPIADSDAPFEFSEPRYATIRQKMCFVDCDALSSEDSETVEGISLMLRRTKSGWRVAGMMLQGDDANGSNLLSFENLTDLEQIKSSVQFVDVKNGEQ